MGNRADFTIKQGTTAPSIEARLLRDGTPIDGIRDSTILFEMKHTTTGTVVRGLCTVDDEEEANVAYIWNSGDTDETGYYDAEFKVDYSIPESVANFEADETFPSDSFITVKVTETL
jgi:hypothetical protein